MSIGTPASLGSASATDSTATIAMPVGAAVPAGDHVFVFVTWASYTEGNYTVTDSKGNTYQLDVEHAHSSLAVGGSLFSARLSTALTTSDTITVTNLEAFFSARVVAAFSVSGLATSAWLDKTAESESVGTTTAASSTATATTAQADELIIGMIADWANTLTPGAGYTEVHDVGVASNVHLESAYQIVSATGAQTYTSTLSGAEAWVAMVATYKAAAAGDATVTSPPADATGDIPAPAVSGISDGTVTSPVADGVGDIPNPAVAADATIAAPAADATGDIPGSFPMSAEAVAVPADATGDIPAPAVSGSTDATVTSPAVDGVGDVPNPAVAAGAVATPPAADASGDLPAPAATGGASVAGVAAHGAGDLVGPEVTGGVGYPPTVSWGTSRTASFSVIGDRTATFVTAGDRTATILEPERH